MRETEQRFLLKALREASQQLLDELYGLEEEELSWRPNDNEWSLKEIAAHLRDAEELALAQLKAILDTPNSTLPTWDIDLLPAERDYQSEDLRELLHFFARLRRETSYLLWNLFAEDWQRSANHAYRGLITVGQIARELAEHDLGHLWQVRRLKAQLPERDLAYDEN